MTYKMQNRVWLLTIVLLLLSPMVAVGLLKQLTLLGGDLGAKVAEEGPATIAESVSDEHAQLRGMILNNSGMIAVSNLLLLWVILVMHVYFLHRYLDDKLVRT